MYIFLSLSTWNFSLKIHSPVLEWNIFGDSEISFPVPLCEQPNFGAWGFPVFHWCNTSGTWCRISLRSWKSWETKHIEAFRFGPMVRWNRSNLKRSTAILNDFGPSLPLNILKDPCWPCWLGCFGRVAHFVSWWLPLKTDLYRICILRCHLPWHETLGSQTHWE